MSGATPLLPLHVSTAWTGTTLPLPDHIYLKSMLIKSSTIHPGYLLIFPSDYFTHTHTHFSLLSLFIVRPFSPLLLTCTLRSFLQSVVTVSLLGPGTHQHYLPSWKSINWIKTYGRVGAGSQEGYSAVNIKTVAFCNVTSYCLING